MNKLIQFIFLALFILGITSCNKEGCRESVDISNSNLSVKLNRIDLELFETKNIEVFKEGNEEFIEFIEAQLVPVELTSKFLEYAGAEMKLQELREATKKDFKDNAALENTLNEMYARIKVYYPEFEVPKLNLVFSAFGDIHIVDYKNSIYLGTEYFLSQKDKFPIPSDYFPQYIATQMTKGYIPTKLAMLHSNQFNSLNTKDRTLLKEMIAYGKMFYFVGQVLPCAPDDVVMSRSVEDIKNFNTHKKDIWNHMVKNQLFFKEDSETKRHYIEPRPKTVEIANECPGMVGQWLGYEIVKSYMKNNDLTLLELMKETDAKKIFNKSGFKSEVK